MLTATVSGTDWTPVISTAGVMVSALIGAWALFRSNQSAQRLNGRGTHDPSIEQLRKKVKDLEAIVKYQTGQIESYASALRLCEQEKTNLLARLGDA